MSLWLKWQSPAMLLSWQQCESRTQHAQHKLWPPQKEKQRKRKKFSKSKGRQRRQVVWADQFLGRPLDSSGIINKS